ncbi:hypothetical protein WMO40_20780 [Bacillaceae bacterium CLA-AA-H227]|uniref:Uncharacterized protein n=2 Tax=Robertmurraya TaxID=2837507 RepID=A0A4U1CZE2_9BACI|nr:hypothetical protein [Robertmurraya kyonggiensis]TKC15201.1 hypothetical protein FA727_20175 [Robertmurraya kyonggiensis]
MFISLMKTVEAGSDISVEELHVENGGDVKMICVSQESIVGYSTSSFKVAEEKHELFVCYTKKELEKYVSPVVATIAWGFFTDGGENVCIC